MGFLGSLGFTGIVNLFTTLWPIVNTLIATAEATNPQSGSGAQKFNQVLSQVNAVATTLPQVVQAVQASGKSITDAAHAGDVKTLSNGLGDMINLAVKVANSVGAFQKSGFVQSINEAQSTTTTTSAVPPGTD